MKILVQFSTPIHLSKDKVICYKYLDIQGPTVPGMTGEEYVFQELNGRVFKINKTAVAWVQSVNDKE